ncbi:hypothetical protein [Nostoc sp.]|uniref:hypothetical protein n=1 Tax=Nostoc sp. TaxID=1180 RepID=UPI002FFAF8AC
MHKKIGYTALLSQIAIFAVGSHPQLGVKAGVRILEGEGAIADIFIQTNLNWDTSVQLKENG